MKTIILIFIFFTDSFLSAQYTTIYPLGTPTREIVEGGYEKDLNNQLNQFQGTWIYVQGSKKVTLKLEKLIYQVNLPNKNYYTDLIKGRYKVENGSTVVYDDMDEPMLSGDINGSIFSEGYYLMDYWDDPECRIVYDVKIKLDPNNSNKLIWQMRSTELVSFDFEDECTRKLEPDWGTVSTLSVNMVLTRQ